MSNKLEEFIQNNREQFDAEEPGKNSWNKIESILYPAPKKANFFKLHTAWWAAAALIIMLAATTIYFITKNKKESTETVQSPVLPPKDVTDAVDTAYSNDMHQFVRVIEIKQTELKVMGKKNPALYKQFIKDINSLDSAFTNLKTALPANPNKEILMEEMVNNLQLQIDLLNHQLQIIKQFKQKNIEHENKSI